MPEQLIGLALMNKLSLCIGAEKKWVMGRPVKDLVSTSYVEGSNLTLRSCVAGSPG